MKSTGKSILNQAKFAVVAMAITFIPAGMVGLSGNVPAQASEKYQIVNSNNPGEQTNIEANLARGQITIIDMFSEYCPPCRRLSQRLKDFVARRNDVVVRAFDINRRGTQGIDWKSPLAQQYGLRSIPSLKIYDQNGQLMAQGKDARMLVEKWFSDAGLPN